MSVVDELGKNDSALLAYLDRILTRADRISKVAGEMTLHRYSDNLNIRDIVERSLYAIRNIIVDVLLTSYPAPFEALNCKLKLMIMMSKIELALNLNDIGEGIHHTYTIAKKDIPELKSIINEVKRYAINAHN